LNAHAERWVRSVKDECLSKIIPFGERSLRRAMKDYVAHYYTERITKVRTTCCCSIGSAKQTATSQCNVATGWVDFCGTIIKRQRELAVTQSCARICTDLSERFSNLSPEGGLS
jgi:hypothetical protein